MGIVYKIEIETKLQERLDAPMVWKEICNVKYTDSGTWKNPYLTDSTVGTGTRGTGYTSTAVATVDDSVNITDYVYSAQHIDDADLARLIKSFNTGSDSGYGVVYVAELLNKEDGIGNYIAVFFDVRTKKIIFADRVSGKAGGFGLRNYWAAPLEKIFKL